MSTYLPCKRKYRSGRVRTRARAIKGGSRKGRCMAHRMVVWRKELDLAKFYTASRAKVAINKVRIILTVVVQFGI